MIKNSVYIPYFQKDITVTAKDAAELEEYAELAEERRDLILDRDCEEWHKWDGLAQAYLETLDGLRRYEDAI